MVVVALVVPVAPAVVDDGSAFVVTENAKYRHKHILMYTYADKLTLSLASAALVDTPGVCVYVFLL